MVNRVVVKYRNIELAWSTRLESHNFAHDQFVSGEEKLTVAPVITAPSELIDACARPGLNRNAGKRFPAFTMPSEIVALP